MIERLQEIEKQADELRSRQADPEIAVDPKQSREIAQKLAEIQPVVDVFKDYKGVEADLDGARELLADGDDPEMTEMAQAEIDELEPRLRSLEEKLQVMLLPVDPNDKRGVILEVRAGTGGEEASLFAGELLRMYGRYSEGNGWKVSITESSETGLGGINKAVAMIEGDRVYSRLKFESGVHRVQRVPSTESSGRIHTSAATVAVMPEAEEIEVEVEEKDLRIDRFCSSGPGGQSVNTTYSAVRVTHEPTGVVVSCQDEKSQIQNLAKAMRVLKARLLEVQEAERDAERAANRRSQIGSGDRSEKIRTYNFPQGRVTDHRVSLTVHRLQEVLDGDLDLVIDELTTHLQAKMLKEEVSDAS
ncbi:MAG: peptide chain release factor 1 [Acidobacteriota bacterium]